MSTENSSESDTPQALAKATLHPTDEPAHEKCCWGDGPLSVSIVGRPPKDTAHAELNTVIRIQLQRTGFPAYKAYLDSLIASLTGEIDDKGGVGPLLGSVTDKMLQRERAMRGLEGRKLVKIHGTIPYELLRLATEAFLLTRCGPTCVDFGDELGTGATAGVLEEDAARLDTSSATLLARVKDYISQFVSPGAATPYLDTVIEQLLPTLPSAHDPLAKLYQSRWQCVLMIELMWSYWHEEGGQCQAMNAIALRFQNRRSRPGRDPLASLEIDPLRPLSSLLWGWVESAYKRLTVERRAYEYDHHYGLTLMGKAVPPLLSADSRSKFLEGFHSLMHIAQQYYVERADTTRIADGFPLLNALRHVQLILSEGAHNQYGDLPWTARVEMLIEQWLLARPEMAEFLRGRTMVPYQELWMKPVDAMKKLQGWSDVTVTHHHELASCGEAVLLSVRHGPWATTNDQEEAKTWADYWKPEIQRYIYAYKAVTGADLTIEPVSTTMPARLMASRLARQQAASAP